MYYKIDEMKNQVFGGLSILLILIMQIGLVNAQTQRLNYQTVRPTLKKTTRIPILLPSALTIDQPLYGNLDNADRSSYRVNLDFTSDCNGAAVCTYGFITASRLPKNAKPLSGKKVSLANGITGYFLLNDPEQNCNVGYCFAMLTWDLRGVRYQVELKSSEQKDLIEAANSAIQSVY